MTPALTNPLINKNLLLIIQISSKKLIEISEEITNYCRSKNIPGFKSYKYGNNSLLVIKSE